jgi:hypothetical protein
MIPITQTIFGKPYGNCFAACIASILEIPLDKVPNVMSHDDWFARFNWWLNKIGLYLIYFDGWQKEYIETFYKNSYILVYGPAARGVDHACVYKGSALAWDPHPDRTGLLQDPSGWECIAISDPVLFMNFKKRNPL